MEGGRGLGGGELGERKGGGRRIEGSGVGGGDGVALGHGCGRGDAITDEACRIGARGSEDTNAIVP